MPVEAAEEDRVQFARTFHVLRPVQHMIHLVRPFARDMAERGRGEMRGEIGGEAHHGHIISHP
jgi:hypothetical protein